MIISYYPGAGGNKYYRSLSNSEWQTHGISYDTKVTDQDFLFRYLNQNFQPQHENKSVVLTHCVNTPLIKKIFPMHDITVILFDLQDCLRREWILLGHARYMEKLNKDLSESDTLDLYHAVRDPAWPDIQHIHEITTLPIMIQQEIKLEMSKNSRPTIEDSDVVSILQKKYCDQIQSACAQIQYHKTYYSEYPPDIKYAAAVIDMTKQSEFCSHMQKEFEITQSELFDDCWQLQHQQ